MSRRSKGTRLWLEPEERDARNGKLIRRASWVIRDGPRKVRTGCIREDRAGAERALADHIAAKYRVPRERGRHPAEILILDVLHIYLADVAPQHARPDETKQRILTLADFFERDTLAEINSQRCRAYVAWRVGKPWKSARPESTNRPPRLVTAAAARRELEDLRAAINHHRREGLCSEVVSVVLPAKGQSRVEWLTRSEAASIIRAAWRRDRGKHIARFILVGLYTGSRAAAICGASFQPAIGRGHVDLDRGVFHRRAQGARETKKRQPPVRLPARLLAHLRRWRRLGIARTAVVEWHGKPVRSVRKAFAATVAAAHIEKRITPHILRHTAATWLMQAGIDVWQAAGFLGMTVEMIERVYGHHHPDYQVDAARALSGPGQKRDRNTVNKTRRIMANTTEIVELSGRTE
jgi:integrase